MNAAVRRVIAAIGFGVTLVVASGATAAGVSVLVRDEQGRPVSDAVVSLESAAAAKAVRPMSGVEMAQQAKAFQPQVLPVTRGTAVVFPNRDTVRHHVYSLSPAKPFEIKLYAGVPANPVLFDREGVAVLGCNIHDSMVAWVVVLDTPYFAPSDTGGVARLPDAPAGEYRLAVWHPRLPVGAAAQRQTVRLADGRPADLTVVLRGLLP